MTELFHNPSSSFSSVLKHRGQTANKRGSSIHPHSEECKALVECSMLSGNTDMSANISYKLDLPCTHTHTHTWLNVKKEMFQMLLLKYKRR